MGVRDIEGEGFTDGAGALAPPLYVGPPPKAVPGADVILL
jgi:hypothetical protein